MKKQEARTRPKFQLRKQKTRGINKILTATKYHNMFEIGVLFASFIVRQQENSIKEISVFVYIFYIEPTGA